MNACVGLMSVMRLKNADFHIISSLCFDPEQLLCAVIIHSAKRTFNYLFYGFPTASQEEKSILL